MPWQVGIDEAGYGPNLGPFVMTLVACQLPSELEGVCLWEALKTCVRRAGEPADGRVIVADSKLVYSSSTGLNELERTVLSVLDAATLHDLLQAACSEEIPALRQEAWFAGDTALPTEISAAHQVDARRGWVQTCESLHIRWGCIRCAIVPAPRFNDLVDKWQSKGAVLGVALTQLIQQCMEATDDEPMRFVIDKHGGRNNYGALLQHAFADGMVLAEEEGRLRSRYRVEGLNRPVQITFMPKADGEHFTVALASMISKYVRELLMREFNRFWQAHVSGLKPTAGYPQDAARYFEAIQPTMQKLGISDRAVWRSR